MKLYTKLLSSLAMVSLLWLTACVGDLDVTPIDPSLNTPDKVLKEEANYKALLAKCYSALAVSSPSGPNGAPDIEGIDGGFGQYFRGLFNLNVLTTDEAVIGWNDQTLKDLHGLAWSSSDVFVNAMYYRLFYQIAVCNEFVRRASASGIETENMKNYIAEAKCLRALSYYHAIDMFGNVPFATEKDEIGEKPPRITRSELFTWLTEEDIPAMMSDLKPARGNEYGRVDQGVAKMILAKLYLNAEVYTGTAQYDKCAEVCKELVAAGYTLEPVYAHLFGADNDLCTKTEIIFSVYQDGEHAQGYGGTTFMMLAAIGGGMSSPDYGLTESGWGGIRVTPQFVNLFSTGDVRGNFYTEGQSKEITDLGEFTEGYAFVKYTNLKRDGSAGKHGAHPDCDIVVFRHADVLLMLAECAARGSSKVTVAEGLTYMNQLRERAKTSKLASYTLDDVLNERGRELAWEFHRRSDLIRFNKLTTKDYLWAWKGGVADGVSVNSKYNIFPLASGDVNENGNLVQNPGY